MMSARYQGGLKLNINSARISLSAPRRQVWCLASRLVLQPIGDGDTAHIKGNSEIEPSPAVVLPEGIYELGRIDTADIIVPLPTVSGRHAMIRIEDDKKVFITDLGSTNGTSIDSMELEPMKSVSRVSLFF
jgi:pSer/pThr/pTyr-binding forkhead associated (FHA) protein